MSVSLTTNSHGELQGCGFNGADTRTVHIGEYEIPLEEFCGLAAAILGGGMVGWRGQKPECVEKAVELINSR
ncbi:hypothetical protein HOB10_01105 [Candidatus Parcubacteria bacterium]|jgi:hypothetical protein|nr:hypothetical protein [Candidatus Parcubacteria bacterium]